MIAMIADCLIHTGDQGGQNMSTVSPFIVDDTLVRPLNGGWVTHQGVFETFSEHELIGCEMLAVNLPT